MKKIISLITALALVLGFAGCSKKQATPSNNKINVICTVFPQYDIVRTIASDKANIAMLLPPGGEPHSFEPTPKDILNIQNSDVFIMIGGESEKWAEKIIESAGKNKTEVLKLIDCVDTLDEEVTEGMEEEEDVHDEDENDGDEHEHEDDEHIWTSPDNMIVMTKQIYKTLCKADPKNKELYKSNTEAYVNKLSALSDELKEIAESGKRKTLVFADRFPFRYLTESLGIEYYAAFPGCSSQTEPSASTIAFLIDKIKKENIPAVFYVDYTDPRIAKSISKDTTVKTLRMYSCHTVSKEDFENGETYLSLMEKNVAAIKEALN